MLAPPLVPALLLLFAACAPGGPAPSRNDSAAAGAATATSPSAPDESAVVAPAASSPAALAADSAARLDARFQELRAALNRDAAALDASSLDRRSREYAGRYDEIRRRTAVAESLRAARDAQRTRARKLAASPAATAPVPPRADTARRR